MLDSLKHIFDIQKLKLSLLIPICITSFILIILPEDKYTYFGIHDIYKWRWVFVLIFIVFIILIASRIIDYLFNKYKKYKFSKGQKKLNQKILSDLDPLERAYLKKFFNENLNTLTFELSDPVVACLLKKGVFIIVNNQIILRHELHCTINPDFKELINPKTFFN